MSSSQTALRAASSFFQEVMMTMTTMAVPSVLAVVRCPECGVQEIRTVPDDALPVERRSYFEADRTDQLLSAALFTEAEFWRHTDACPGCGEYGMTVDLVPSGPQARR
jgi:hypothetical protein